MTAFRCPACEHVFKTNKMPSSMECPSCGNRVILAESEVKEELSWEEQLDRNRVEEMLDQGLAEEESDEEAAATYLRGQLTYAIARICWAALREYNLTLGVNSRQWLKVPKETQVMMVSIAHGIIAGNLRHPMDVHSFTVRYLRSAGLDQSDHPDMQPWTELTDDQKRKPMITFGLVVALLADPDMFARV